MNKLQSVYYTQLNIFEPSSPYRNGFGSANFDVDGLAINSAYYTGSAQSTDQLTADQFINRSLTTMQNSLSAGLLSNVFASVAEMEAFSGHALIDIELNVSLFDLDLFDQDTREGIIEATGRAVQATRNVLPNATLMLYGISRPNASERIEDLSFLRKTEFVKQAIQSDHGGYDELNGLTTVLYSRFGPFDEYNNGNLIYATIDDFLEETYYWTWGAIRSAKEIAQAAERKGRNLLVQPLLYNRVVNGNSDSNGISILDLIPDNPNGVLEKMYLGCVAGGSDYDPCLWSDATTSEIDASLEVAQAIREVKSNINRVTQITKCEYHSLDKKVDLEIKLQSGFWKPSSTRTTTQKPIFKVDGKSYTCSNARYEPDFTITDSSTVQLSYYVGYDVHSIIDKAIKEGRRVLVDIPEGMVIDENDVSAHSRDIRLIVVNNKPTRTVVHIWGDPPKDPINFIDRSHYLWTVDNVFPMARIFLPSTIGAPSEEAVALADKIEQTQAFFQSVNRSYNQYSVFVQGFGGRDGLSLMNHPDDAISVEFGTQGPFVANGINECRTFSEAFFAALKSELDSRSLPYPVALHTDYEGNMGNLAGALNWMDAALVDPRATTEIIDGENTFERLATTFTMTDGAPLSWNEQENYYNTLSNRPLRMFVDNVRKKIRNYALFVSYWEPAKKYFPNVVTSNYQEFAASYENPVYGGSKLDSLYVYNNARWSDKSSPVFYMRGGSEMQGIGSWPADWFSEFGLTFDTTLPDSQDYKDLSIAWMQSDFDSIKANEALLTDLGNLSGSNIIPWIDYTGRVTSLPDGDDGAQELERYEEDIKRVIDVAVGGGSRELLFWYNDDVSSEVYDSLGSLAIYAESLAVAEDGEIGGETEQDTPFTASSTRSNPYLSYMGRRIGILKPIRNI